MRHVDFAVARYPQFATQYDPEDALLRAGETRYHRVAP